MDVRDLSGKGANLQERVAPISPEAWAMYYLKRLAPAALYATGRWLARRAAPPVIPASGG